MGKGKIIGLSVTITTLTFISLTLFIKALSVKFDSFFTSHVDYFLWGSLIAIIFLSLAGGVSLSTLINKSGSKNEKKG